MSRPESPDSFTVVGPPLPGAPRRTRKSFKTEEEARAKAVEFDELHRKHKVAQKAPDMRMAPTRLNLKQLREAESVFDLLSNDPRSAERTLTQIVQLGLGAKVVRSRPLRELVEDFLKLKETENLEPRSLQSLRSTLRRFAVSGELTHEAVQKFIYAKTYKEAGVEKSYSPTSQRNRRTPVGQFLRWCVAESYLAEDFTERIKGPRIGDSLGEIATLTPVQARALLDAARSIDSGRLFAYVLLGTWAGVRPSELEHLNPSQIDLERGTVEVGKLRTPSRRIHRLAPIALYHLRQSRDSLRYLPVAKGASEGFRVTFALIRGTAGLSGEWIPDTMRHTYISHAVPLITKEEVAKQAGNSVAVIDRHYRVPKHADDVAQFWLRGWPLGDRLLERLSPNEAEAWMKAPNADFHGIAPVSMTMEAFESAVENLLARGKKRKRDSRS